ncbi:MAG: cysteine hydrolase [Calditrichaeota bacterium]|nr:cysteine hydrolase [Calditrichota bacterium]RQW00949.1 MAG: cysteine hydrolase [Calditrichota bacterium]
MAVPFIPAKKVEVPDIQFEKNIELPADKTAVIIVDMQNDFVKDEGNLNVPTAKETIGNIQKILQAARKKGMHIAYTQDTAVEGDPEFDIWPEHCIKDTWGWEIVDELKPEKKDLICPKNRYDGFYGTWLDHFLINIWKVEHVVIMGTVSNICVLHTAASAGLRWLKIVMPADGISALTEFDQALTLRQVSSLYGGKITESVDNIKFI